MDHYAQVRSWIYRALFLLGLLLCLSLAQLEIQQGFINQFISNSDLSASESTRIVIERPNYNDISLFKQEENWVVFEPCQLPANEYRLEPLLSLAIPSKHQYRADEVDLEAAGLSQPLAALTLNNNRILIGNTDLGGDRRYIQRGQTVELVPAWVLDLINGGLSAIANLQVFNEKLQQIRLSENTSQAVLSSNPQHWQALTAQQIVEWPFINNEYAIQSSHTIEVMFEDHSNTADLHLYKNFAGLVYSDSNCAYIMAIDDIPFNQN